VRFLCQVLVDVDILADLPHQLLMERLRFAFVVEVEYEILSRIYSLWKMIGHLIANCRRCNHIDVANQGNKTNQVKRHHVAKKNTNLRDGVSTPHDLATNESLWTVWREGLVLWRNQNFWTMKKTLLKKVLLINKPITIRLIRYLLRVIGPTNLVLNNTFQNLIVLDKHVNDEPNISHNSNHIVVISPMQPLLNVDTISPKYNSLQDLKKGWYVGGS